MIHRYFARNANLAAPTSPCEASGHVVALHGLAMGGYATAHWRKALSAAGFSTSAFNYRSMSRTLDQNADSLAAHLRSLESLPLIHLAGHSLGGLVILRCLERHHFPNVGRVALAGSPAQGSAPAANIARNRLGKALLGRSITAWSGPDLSRPSPGVEFGSVAGIKKSGLGAMAARFEGPHDGTVALSETRLDAESARHLARASHTGLLLSPAVAREIAHFLAHGRFSE